MLAQQVMPGARFQVGSILNFSLMYFLAPTAGATAAGANLLQKLISEQTLRAWGAPGTSCLPLCPLPLPALAMLLVWLALVRHRWQACSKQSGCLLAWLATQIEWCLLTQHVDCRRAHV